MFEEKIQKSFGLSVSCVERSVELWGCFEMGKFRGGDRSSLQFEDTEAYQHRRFCGEFGNPPGSLEMLLKS